MRTVTAEVVVGTSLAETERRWYETDRWPGWVDGLDAIESVQGDWPRAGATVQWRSMPAGRGQVTEHVVEYEPSSGQVVEVRDDTMTGRQTVVFIPDGDTVEVSLKLEYRVSRRTPLTPLLELLFVNRAFRASMEITLGRFAAELDA